MSFKLFLAASAAVAMFALAQGCSSSDDKTSSSSSSSSGENGEPTSPFPSCQEILHACHPLDVGEGPIHDCHETAHDDGTEAKCAAAKDQCLKTCVAPSDAGTSTDSGDAGDHSH